MLIILHIYQLLILNINKLSYSLAIKSGLVIALELLIKSTESESKRKCSFSTVSSYTSFFKLFSSKLPSSLEEATSIPPILIFAPLIGLVAASIRP